VLKGKFRKVIGIDDDPAVKANPSLDEVTVIGIDEKLPLAEGSVDLIVSDLTFEHIVEPAFVSSELDRILKPGGWISARTTDRWRYIGVGANPVPNGWHVSWLKLPEPHRKEFDVFSTAYRLNTLAALRQHFSPKVYRHCTYSHFGDSTNFGQNRMMSRLVRFLYRLLPEALAPMWILLLQKRATK
jgi:SAM-dependent methyltransferase